MNHILALGTKQALRFAALAVLVLAALVGPVAAETAAHPQQGVTVRADGTDTGSGSDVTDPWT
ncbi:hypothetical protein [Streptomyces humi]